MFKDDGEIERMTLCIARMAATLEAADRSLPPDNPRYRTDDGLEHPSYYAARARALYEAAEANIAGLWPNVAEATENAN